MQVQPKIWGEAEISAKYFHLVEREDSIIFSQSWSYWIWYTLSANTRLSQTLKCKFWSNLYICCVNNKARSSSSRDKQGLLCDYQFRQTKEKTLQTSTRSVNKNSAEVMMSELYKVHSLLSNGNLLSTCHFFLPISQVAKWIRLKFSFYRKLSLPETGDEYVFSILRPLSSARLET